VPLAMDTELVAHDVRKENAEYIVTYEGKDEWYVFFSVNMTSIFSCQGRSRSYRSLLFLHPG
jgi:YHS domain-containing protein